MPMIENKTGGNHLILRRAKPGERMTTVFGAGDFSGEDTVICDERTSNQS